MDDFSSGSDDEVLRVEGGPQTDIVKLSAKLEEDVADPTAAEMDVPQAPTELPKVSAMTGVEVPPDHCIECEDAKAAVKCRQCADAFCAVCFQATHRKGKRTMHTAVPMDNVEEENGERDPVVDDAAAAAALRPAPLAEVGSGEWFSERAQHIPLRLSLQERKLLRLLKSALQVSEYTDKVDRPHKRGKRVVAQLQEICATLSGIVVAANYKIGQELTDSKAFSAHAEFFQTIFEIGRRHKVMNPEKMRGEYGKLVYMLQDTMTDDIQELLRFGCVKDIRTVHTLLEEKGGLDLLKDPLMATATMEIIPDGKHRYEIQREIKAKEEAVKALCRRYHTRGLTPDDIQLCLYSIGDNHSYLRTNRDPVDKMIEYLKAYFHPDRVEDGYSLAIAEGTNGARLTHNHGAQYAYVLQSMTLWREILHDMFRLWHLAEQDLVGEGATYTLTDTGQGLQRVQQAPRIARAMQRLLHDAQRSVGSWVGSSVVHLGDKNVPNALVFIDKYTQISRILNPIVTCLKQIEILAAKNPTIDDYVTTSFGGVEGARKTILADFFRSAFDGSGADNFYDAGSCIDGRLTSAWNWCQALESKPFHNVFLLTGFTSFDGEFN